MSLALEDVPHLLIDLSGRCTYASRALATLLQCGVGELLGDGWRCRLSPFADGPFDARRLLGFADERQPMRLHSPAGNVEVVTRFRTVTDPLDPEKTTGLFGQVQVVRVHRRKIATVAGIVLSLLSA